MERYLKQAIGLDSGFEPSGREHYETLIRQQVDDLLKDMGQDQYRTSSFKSYMDMAPLGKQANDLATRRRRRRIDSQSLAGPP